MHELMEIGPLNWAIVFVVYACFMIVARADVQAEYVVVAGSQCALTHSVFPLVLLW